VTAQALDQVRWRGRTWSLVGIDGDGLFDPTALGIVPQMLHTAAWRGSICCYAVENDELRLRRLEIGFDPLTQERALAGDPPVIADVRPRQQGTGYVWLYDEADLPVPFTGGLRIGHGFIQELYVHMGFAPAWKFEEVHELRFESGRLVAAVDESDAMRRQRELATKEPLAPPRGSGVERITDWIRGTFDRTYRR
jgi:hypothetical protein